ncbi:MAG: hypothetical protein KJ900_05215 [Proteobacteria bacterium]|nr:hypothetical protein [Desulfocapsa sp.]MBU3944339.1 hypothetical protein [Pseudomonadota bacterium]MCG2745844.1 hypothetical protein [Desulfobacteraceae bacterium]MBU4029819.1 hypothetical protein [Pseudomonadota bacterium]MBU4042281.1 hypothetical protein [Pseudomonadota bacterium]
MKEIEMMAEPLEMEIPEPTITIKLTTRLRCSATKEYHPSHCEMLHDAANEIERLQAIVRSNDPVVLLKEMWKHHQPVYLFEAIADTQKEKSHGLQ